MGSSRRRARRAFTLVEVLAAMLLIAIVLPIVMKGISLGVAAASDTRHRNEAAGLAQEKLGELLATYQWQNGTLSGDFGTDWPGYRWQATVQNWAGDTTTSDLQEIDLSVQWTGRGKDNSVTVSTLAYARGSM